MRADAALEPKPGLGGSLLIRGARETYMRAILLSTLALGAITTAALAEQPLTLSDDQMDKVTAGGGNAVVTPGTNKVVLHPGPALTGTAVGEGNITGFLDPETSNGITVGCC